MKKHKFLSIFAIMFALVFALSICFFAACGNKEDNNDDTTVTIPDDNEGNDGSEESGDDDGDDDGQAETTVLDARIYAADSDDTFTFDEVTYFDATALEITPTAGKDGDVDYTVEGTASLMTEEQADSFWKGVAAKYDAYICYKIKVADGETISYKTTSDDKSYTNSADADADLFDGEYLHMVARISGDDGNGGTLSAKDVTYKITDGETTTNHNVSFNITIPERDLSHVSVNFGSGDATTGYGWIKTTQRTQEDSNVSNPEYYFDVNPLDNENTEPYTSDILSLATTYEDMIVRSDKSALTTGGTASNAEQGNYFEIDLSDYEGYYVTVTVEFSNTGSNSARSLLLASEVTSDIGDDCVLAYVSSSSEVTVSSGNTPPTLKYAMKIDECDTLYLTWDNSIYIYTIDILISKEADTNVDPTDIEISFDHDKNADGGLTLTIPENYNTEESPLTLGLVATVKNRNNWKYKYDGAVTWEITDSEREDGTNGDVISLAMNEGTDDAAITAIAKGTATITVTLDEYTGVSAALKVVVTDAYIIDIRLDNPDWLSVGSDVETVIVTMTDGWQYTGTYSWYADENNDSFITIEFNSPTEDAFKFAWGVPDPGEENLKAIFTLTLDDGSQYRITCTDGETAMETVTMEMHLSWYEEDEWETNYSR